MSEINKVAVHEAGHAIMRMRYGYCVAQIHTAYQLETDDGTGWVSSIYSTIRHSETVSTISGWENWKKSAIRDLIETAGGPIAEGLFEDLMSTTEKLDAGNLDWSIVGGNNHKSHMYAVVDRWKRLANTIAFDAEVDGTFEDEVLRGVSLVLQHVLSELNDEQTWATVIELARLLSERNGENVDFEAWKCLPEMQRFKSRFPNYKVASLPGELIHRLSQHTESKVTNV